MYWHRQYWQIACLTSLASKEAFLMLEKVIFAWCKVWVVRRMIKLWAAKLCEMLCCSASVCVVPWFITLSRVSILCRLLWIGLSKKNISILVPSNCTLLLHKYRKSDGEFQLVLMPFAFKNRITYVRRGSRISYLQKSLLSAQLSTNNVVILPTNQETGHVTATVWQHRYRDNT